MKFDDVNYDDEKATEEQDGFAPKYGIFKATIKSITDPKGGDDFEMKYTKKNAPFYTARVNFEYTDNDGKKAEKAAFFNFGLWFPVDTKEFMSAIGADNVKDRTAQMKDTSHLVGRKCDIGIGARKATDYEIKEKDARTFKGYILGEYEGSEFIRNEIVKYAPLGEGKHYELINDEFEKKLREDFKSGNEDSGYKEKQPGFDNEPVNF